jgi:multiple sugar transport system substrate-binding protein
MLGLGAAGLAVKPRDVLAADPAANAPVQFWDMSWGPAAYALTARKLVDQFNEQSATVKVVYRHFDWSEWPGNFAKAIASGMVPDLSTGGANQPAQFDDEGATLDISDVIAELRQTGEDKDFSPGSLEQMIYRNHAVGLPWAIDLRVPYYRKDLFARAGIREPESWDELRATARKLTAGGQYGFVVAGTEIDGMHILFALMINNGGGLFDTEGKLDVMNARNVEAMSFLSNLVKDGSVNPGSVHFSGADANREFFSSGGAMMISGPNLHKAFPGEAQKIALLPPLPGPHGDKGTFGPVNSIMLYKHGGNAEGAKTFLRWWSENQKPLWSEGHCDQIPVRKSIAADAYFQSDPFTRQLLSQWVSLGESDAARSPGILSCLNDIEGDGVMMTLLQDLLKGKDVIASMEKAETRLKTIVK